MAADDKRSVLDRHIDELESLIADQRGPVNPAAVPVLDELAEHGAAAEPDAPPLEPKQLVEIWHRLEHRIDVEMADLAEALKSVLKRSIREELRSCMPTSPRHPGAAAPDASAPAGDPKSGVH
jgi:hypothetical protein